ncbi:MAG TPA: efflux RND transporter periplasmic adaptor subunit [Rhodocyclaceae bacterium]|nr:efflux RND transporter periplasmic adaptor subunit [Rhodocyclaceae bacterium]
MTAAPRSSHTSRPTAVRRAVLATALVAALGAAAWFAWDRFMAPGDAVAAYQFATAQRGDIEELVTATGTLQPRDYVDVGAQVSGQLERIHVEIGSAVQAGELLAEIDPTVLASRVDATRAQLRFQRAQLAERKTGLELARTQYRRQQNLMREDATSTEALESARAAVRSAAAQVEALEAQIEQTESNLRADEANLDYARIYAPMSGTVVSISVRQGQTLNASQQAPVILRIADLATMTVQTQVSEADVGKLRLGMPAYFTTLGGRGRRWHGTLDKIEPTPVVQNNVVLYNALFDVPNADGRLMTQMTAQVFFVVDAASDGVLIPMSALEAARAAESPRRPAGGGPARGAPAPGDRQATVLVATPGGSLEARSVELGVSNRVQVQVTAGLADGERVVSGSAPEAASRRGPAQ